RIFEWPVSFAHRFQRHQQNSSQTASLLYSVDHDSTMVNCCYDQNSDSGATAILVMALRPDSEGRQRMMDSEICFDAARVVLVTLVNGNEVRIGLLQACSRPAQGA